MGFFGVRFEEAVPVRDDSVAPTLVISQKIPTAVRRARPPFFMPDFFGYEYLANGDQIVVPADVERSMTDLASIPVWLGWLAAKTGRNLPAALLHDVLIVNDDSEVNHWIAKRGEPFERATEPYPPGAADSMFRDAMGDVGVDFLRRWIMWAGISLGTFWKQLPGGRRRGQALVRAVALGALALFAGLYLLPNLVLDLLDVDWAAGWELPGMGDRSWLAEVGGVLAILAVLSLVATLLLALGTAGPAYWLVGAMFVVTLFLLGWLIVFSYLQDLLFKTRLLFSRRSVVLSSPASQTAPEGSTAVFEATVRLKEGGTLQWIEETADGQVTRLDVSGPELVIQATPDKDGAMYKAVIFEDDEIVDESFAATLTLDN